MEAPKINAVVLATPVDRWRGVRYHLAGNSRDERALCKQFRNSDEIQQQLVFCQTQAVSRILKLTCEVKLQKAQWDT